MFWFEFLHTSSHTHLRWVRFICNYLNFWGCELWISALFIWIRSSAKLAVCTTWTSATTRFVTVTRRCRNKPGACTMTLAPNVRGLGVTYHSPMYITHACTQACMHGRLYNARHGWERLCFSTRPCYFQPALRKTQTPHRSYWNYERSISCWRHLLMRKVWFKTFREESLGF